LSVSTLFSFKLGLLLFWGLWYAIAFFTNVCEMLHALRVFPRTWPFASGNLRDVTQATKTYSGMRWLPRLLFFCVLGFQLLIVCLFGWAVVSSLAAGSIKPDAVNTAFAASLGLWAAFMLADEIFKQYDTEHAHVLFFIAQLVTFVAFQATP